MEPFDPDAELAAIRARMRASGIAFNLAKGMTQAEAEAATDAALNSPLPVPLPTLAELDAIEYADMTDGQKRIVDAGDQIAGTFPTGMTKEQLATWIKERFGH